MRKLILGILAVVCVQFAFVIYMSLQSQMEVAVGPVHSDSQIALSDPVTAEPDNTEDTTEESEEAVPRAEPQPVEASSAPAEPRRPVTSAGVAKSRPNISPVEEPVRRPAEYPTAATESRSQSGVFETVVISYDRSSAISDCDIQEPPKPRKRTYIAKAAPVIKKPWEWIKSIGSKLN